MTTSRACDGYCDNIFCAVWCWTAPWHGAVRMARHPCTMRLSGTVTDVTWNSLKQVVRADQYNPRDHSTALQYSALWRIVVQSRNHKASGQIHKNLSRLGA